MNQRIVKLGKISLLLTIFAGLVLIPGRMPAEPAPGKQDALVAKMVCFFLQKGHLSQHQLGEEASRRLFKRFIKDLDPTKVYLLQSDVEDLKKSASELTDMLQKGDLSFAYKVYERFSTRMDERMKLIEGLV